ncbi:unnamed protein product [Acanthoscelides obtectus]|uniref:Uncharacterized protein n=1 Tax=Acanthoscelides obtectus TaxID=200917 RepID=A0A9P0M9C5_ACAOB|nr:unnamed protein product [Acanthoscelides obtectus]CAK1685307.1 hypothetical protein AOBTE_LOCUS35321 [Acanthoscelides obtectus]
MPYQAYPGIYNMPRFWIKKTKRIVPPSDVMKAAVEEVLGGAKLRATARKYDIDKQTLSRYHDDLFSTSNKQKSSQKSATPPQSSSSDEEEQSELGGSSEDISDVESY